MRSERERLLDIQEAIERIEEYAALGRLRFEGDELIQSWIVRHLQIIGEAVRSLPTQKSRPSEGRRQGSIDVLLAMGCSQKYNHFHVTWRPNINHFRRK